jgi:uncharacterized protein YbcI
MTLHHEMAGDVRRRIARGLVAIFKHQFGRGPTTAQAFINGDVVTVVLRDSLTPVERILVDHDDAPVVSELRHGFQTAICDDVTALVEREMGRAVIAFLSDHNVTTDIAVEVFVLEPEAGPHEDETPCRDLQDQEPNNELRLN